MTKLNNAELLAGITKTWAHENFNIGESFTSIIGGTIILEHHHKVPLPNTDHEIAFFIIKDPTHEITNEQLCQIIDEGNHCLSKGSIIYEENLCYITWSNLGHM